MKLSRRLIPDVTTLQAFECAARHGSFTQAAHELNLTQSAVSRQIKDLEEQLGVLLFERVRQRVVLSDDGRRFLPEVRKLLHQTEETMLRAMAHKGKIDLVLHCGVILLFHGTFSGLMQAEAAAIMMSLYLLTYRKMFGYIKRVNGRQVYYRGRVPLELASDGLPA